MKSESKQNTTDLTYLYWAHSQWNLHHHWNIQLMKRCHLLSGMWSKGTKENKSKLFANQEAITEEAKYPRKRKGFTIVTFKILKLYQELHMCKCILHWAGVSCQRNSAYPELLNISGVHRCCAPAGLFRAASGSQWHCWMRYNGLQSLPGWQTALQQPLWMRLLGGGLAPP